MNSYKRYHEIATVSHKIGDRLINEGDVVRVVSISEKDAQIMNETEESRDEQQGGQKYRYVLEGVTEEKAKVKKAKAE